VAVEALVVRHAARVRPVERMVGRQRALLRFGVVDPLVLRRVPVDRQHLPPAVGEHGDIVLHPLAADHPVDREVGERTIGTVGTHLRLSALARHPRFGRGALEVRALEIPDEELRLGRRQRARVPALLPALVLLVMTVSTLRAADECHRRWRRRWRCINAMRIDRRGRSGRRRWRGVVAALARDHQEENYIPPHAGTIAHPDR